MEIETHKRMNHKNEFVKATNLETNEVKFFKNGMDASREIGCSHVLAYKVLKKQLAIARGWKLEYISKDDPQCEKFKKKIEERIQSQRRMLVEYAQYEMNKRREFLKEARAQRKAQHDEIVKELRGMIECAIESLKNQLAYEA